jgi:hypothetical protein
MVKDSLNGALGFGRKNALLALCLVSTPDQIKEFAGQAIRHGASRGPFEQGIFCPTMCVEYLAGLKTESEFLNEASQHGFTTASAHCTIAMKYLSQRDRLRAREHFTKAVATNVINQWDYEFSRACLARMNADPNWPRFP